MRRGYVLASTLVLIFMMTVLMGVAVSHLQYFSMITEARFRGFQAVNAVESMTNLSFKWLSEEIKDGVRPRAQAVLDMEYLTDLNSLRIFASSDFKGCEVIVYDLDYAADRAGSGRTRISVAEKPFGEPLMFPPSFPGGYMVRATAEQEGMAPLTLESVYVVTLNAVPGGNFMEVLDEKPVYSRELFRK